MLDRHLDFVAVDLASVLVFSSSGVRRCLDAAFRSCEPDDAVAEEPTIRHVFGALERVLVAHVTCDPFVHAIPGLRAFLSKLAARRLTAIGVAPFSAPVAHAAARRFGWLDAGMVIATTESDGHPLWLAATTMIQRSALARGAFVTDNTWELASAIRAGCALPIELRPVGELEANAPSDVVRVATILEALSVIIDGPASREQGEGHGRASGTIARCALSRISAAVSGETERPRRLFR